VTDDGPEAGPAIGSQPGAPLPLGLWAIAVLLVIGGIAFLLGASLPGYVAICDALPLTSTEKIQRARLKDARR